jgi:hypothetical protein
MYFKPSYTKSFVLAFLLPVAFFFSSWLQDPYLYLRGEPKGEMPFYFPLISGAIVGVATGLLAIGIHFIISKLSCKKQLT